MYLSNEELNNVIGGGFSAALLNAISRGISTIYNLGYSIGSSLRRALGRTLCKI